MARSWNFPATLLAGALALTGFAACGSEKDPNLIAGKRAFVQKCGSCHQLARAGTTGVTGPNLDEAFNRSIQDGIKRDTIQGVVHRQIEQPNLTPQMDPDNPVKQGALMPANLVKGDLARDVAAYVAFAAARTGKDAGRLAEIGTKKASGTATAQNGALSIPTDPGGGLSYTVATASAPAGALTISSPNKAAIPHNIALEGPGVDEKGPIVTGATSEIKVTLKPGEYTFYCSVPGHRDGGMQGKLTVK